MRSGSHGVSSGDPEASVLLVESPEPGPVRVSLRSKGQVDVARFAEQFGGGGHARAAGMKVEGSVLEVREKLAEALVREMAAYPFPNPEQVTRRNTS